MRRLLSSDLSELEVRLMVPMLIHIAGVEVQVGSQLRQRCAWCGAILVDQDLNLVMVPVDQPGTVPTWPTGSLVAVQGYTSWVVDHEDGAQLPPEACGQIDYEVTV
jgi:hypothetical protein